MTRLLQGDVGSGKTVVAAAALIVAVQNGAQGVIMAPTEILAEQHYKSFQDFGWIHWDHGQRKGIGYSERTE